MEQISKGATCDRSIIVDYLWGCEPSVDKSDLGTVVEELPDVPGADKPFEMPELGPPPPEESEFGEHGMH